MVLLSSEQTMDGVFLLQIPSEGFEVQQVALLWLA